MDDRISAEHRRRNEVTRGDWSGFAEHRAAVTEQLTRGRDVPRGRLCVLGAGNLNDVDLPALLAAYAEVHLVDVDHDAVAAGLARQHVDADKRITIHAPYDVSGVLAALADVAADLPADDAAIDAIVARAAAGPQTPLPGPFDTVASTCLLTQLIDSAAMAVGREHPRLLDVVQAMRQRHARLMVDLLASAGLGILFCDVVSSGTAPELARVDRSDFPAAVAALVASGNFFTGANPALLRSAFADEPSIAAALADVQLVRPWPWRLGPRTLAVCAVKFLKAWEPAPTAGAVPDADD